MNLGLIKRWLGVLKRKFGNELWVCECKVITWRFLLICLRIGCGIDIELRLGPSHLVYNFERQFQALWIRGVDVVQRCRDNRVCNWMDYLNWFPYSLQKYTPRVGHSLHLQCWGWIIWNRDHVYWWNREAKAEAKQKKHYYSG